MAGDVYLFFRSEEIETTSALRKHVAEVCKARSWNFQPRSVRTVRAPNGRPITLLTRDIAAGLYKRAHRTRVAILVIGSDPRVPLHPDEAEVLKFQTHIPLRRFTAYKSCWVRIPKDSLNDSWVGMFSSWCKRTECDGEHDPRCLPFHVFSGDGLGLDEAQRREDFDARYGSGANRLDDESSRWLLNPAIFHGTESLHIAGYILRAGCHWDVTATEWRISTPAGLWWVKQGHVNIYPDAHVRPRGSAANVRKVM
jgi:hypothetical protein